LTAQKKQKLEKYKHNIKITAIIQHLGRGFSLKWCGFGVFWLISFDFFFPDVCVVLGEWWVVLSLGV